MTAETSVSAPRRTLFALACIASLLIACTTQASPRPDEATATATGGDAGAAPNQAGTRMRITVGSKVFSATLGDNETANAFKALLPLSVSMTELNRNEKYFDLAAELPARATNPGTIHAGDLMLYGSNTLVLFYKTFSTSYSYTRIGKVDDASALAAAVGSRNVTVTFAL